MNASILFLCSDAVIRSVIAETLETEGYVVLAVGDLGTAVDRLQEYKPDLLIVRPYIEDISGHDAAHYLRTKRPGMLVLILSGSLDDDRLQYREALEAFEIFPKPFTAAELLKKVADVLGPVAKNSSNI
jgi:DNA-binding response OmpR family regulator